MRLRLKLNLVNVVTRHLASKSSRSMKNGTKQDSNFILNMAQVPIPPLAPDYVTQHDVWDQPRKYTGYKKYSWFLASDDDFMIFRRFGTLNARIILALQDELSVAEEKLKKLDEDYSSKSAPRLHNGSFRYEKDEEQQQERRKLIFE